MLLSDAFSGAGDMEVRVTAYNINIGNNRELMDKCEALRGYSYMIARERAHEEAGMQPAEAIDAAIADCIQNDIFKEYFESRRATVADIFMTEYDEQEVIRRAALAAYREGRNEGRTEGYLTMVSNLMRNQGIDADEAMRTLGVPEPDRPRIRELLQGQVGFGG